MQEIEHKLLWDVQNLLNWESINLCQAGTLETWSCCPRLFFLNSACFPASQSSLREDTQVPHGNIQWRKNIYKSLDHASRNMYQTQISTTCTVKNALLTFDCALKSTVPWCTSHEYLSELNCSALGDVVLLALALSKICLIKHNVFLPLSLGI